jgi:hypothetical protein
MDGNKEYTGIEIHLVFVGILVPQNFPSCQAVVMNVTNSTDQSSS